MKPLRPYFMQTDRIGFSQWKSGDEALAELLWGDPDVTRYLCVGGIFSKQDIQNRLEAEIRNGLQYKVQYWPIFELSSSELVGCCGLRPWGPEPSVFELGFHLRKKDWGKGYASEAARAVIRHAFSSLRAAELRAGHHPDNGASKKLLTRLGFQYVKDNYYAPTGLYHPSYRLPRP